LAVTDFLNDFSEKEKLSKLNNFHAFIKEKINTKYQSNRNKKSGAFADDITIWAF